MDTLLWPLFMYREFKLALRFRLAKVTRNFSWKKWITAPSPIWSALLLVLGILIGIFIAQEVQMSRVLKVTALLIYVFSMLIPLNRSKLRGIWHECATHQPLFLSFGLVATLVYFAFG